MKGRSLVALPVLAFALSCDDARHPTGVQKFERNPSDIILDGAHGGNPDFWFLAPMVPSPHRHPNFKLGTFNNALQPSLRIEICELKPEGPTGTDLPKNSTRCKASATDPNVDATPIKVFPAGTVNLVNLPLKTNGWWSLFNLPPDGFYYVLWNTRQSSLNVNRYYRIKVLLEGSDVPLGVADVDPMSSLRQWKHSLTGEVIQLIDDMLLPIPFRIEQGALCGGDLCTSVTVDDNDGVTEVVQLEGPEGAIAGAEFQDGTLPDNGPQSIVVTITRVNTGSTSLVQSAARQTQEGSTLCHPTLELEQFEGCFNFTTIPELQPINTSGDQFLKDVRVAVCFELEGKEDPREEFVQLYASDVGEEPRALPTASDEGLLSAGARDCGEPATVTFNSGFKGFASAGWRKVKGGLGKFFGVKTAYALDAGLGGLVKGFSNISPALTAEIQMASDAEKEVGDDEPASFRVRIVGKHHHGEHEGDTGLPNMPVEFKLVESETCSGFLSGSETGTLAKTTNSDGYAEVDLNVSSGTCTLEAATKKALGGKKTFTATFTEPLANPILALTDVNVILLAAGNLVVYELGVTNYDVYPSSMFALAPDLPTCNGTTQRRTWVEVYNASNDSFVFRFCAFDDPADLQSFDFPTQQGTAPAQVYIKIIDRERGVAYTSNTISLTPPAPPDFVVTSGAPVLTPSRITTDGGVVQVSQWTVKNQGGNFSSEHAVTLGFFLSDDNSLNRDEDTFLLGRPIAVANLQAGASISSDGTTSLAIPPLEPGTYHVGILLDPANEFTEGTVGEGNNYVTAPLTVVVGTEVLDQSNTPESGNNLGASINDCCRYVAQTFTAGFTGTLVGVNINVGSTSAHPLNVAIRTTVDGVPTSIILGQTTLETSAAPLSQLITFPATIRLSAGAIYAIVVGYPSAPPNQPQGSWGGTTGDLYPAGLLYLSVDGTSWFPSGSGPGSGHDVNFRTRMSIAAP